MRILVANDDGYKAKGLHELVEILRPYGHLTVVSPKFHQSGMSMAVNLGGKPIAVKKLSEEDGVSYWYVDGTPSSCVKFGIDNILPDSLPELVVSGINHGANYGTAALYSGTLGAATEAALAGIRSVAVSLDCFDPDADFSAIRKYFPPLLDQILALKNVPYGVLYNINFPNIPVDEIKGVRVCRQGILHWEREFQPFPFDTLHDEGEELYQMVGDVVSDPANADDADHLLIRKGYITVVAHNLDNTDYAHARQLRESGLEKDFR
ncbi:MAG: 5'/3'-nucleotidase SurE [Bacteroidales bacterium]|nr:5'/3'-nucleotidase SurE [Bacteroidales bacterium]